MGVRRCAQQRLNTSLLLLLHNGAWPGPPWMLSRPPVNVTCASAARISQQACQLRLHTTHQQQLAPGASFSLRKRFTQQDVQAFLSITGDANPIHSQPDAARRAGFSVPVLPGILLASLFPAIIGTHFPGALYLTQSLAFKAPALVGSEVEAVVTVTKASGRRVVFGTRCYAWASDAAGASAASPTLLVDGSALALLTAADPT